MPQKIDQHPVVFKLMSAVALVFGLMTIKSGGIVLFTDGAAHQTAGQYVPFVLWFNFAAGFVYIFASVGLWKQSFWAGPLTLFIALSTVAVFGAFGVHILMNGAYETRTIGAMTLRSFVWVAITWAVFSIDRSDTSLKPELSK